MSLPLKVLGDRVLIKPDRNTNAPEQQESGVYLAKSLAAAVTGDDATDSICRGTVIAVGNPRHPLFHETQELAQRVDWLAVEQAESTLSDAAQLLRDLVRREPAVSIGDDVLFSHDAGQEIALESERYFLLSEDELLAVVESA